MDCIFCGVIEKTVPATLIYEDNQVIAFHDIHPLAPIHQLIIPRKHFATLNDMNEADEGLLGHMIWVAKELAKNSHISEDGYRLVLNCNHEGGQTVYHLHLHLMGGRMFQWPPG